MTCNRCAHWDTEHSLVNWGECDVVKNLLSFSFGHCEVIVEKAETPDDFGCVEFKEK